MARRRRPDSGDLPLDSDGDGLANTLEYSLNTDPHSPFAPDGADRLPAAGTSGDGFATIAFDLPTTALSGGHGCPGVTYQVEAGSSLAGWTVMSEKVPGRRRVDGCCRRSAGSRHRFDC